MENLSPYTQFCQEPKTYGEKQWVFLSALLVWEETSFVCLPHSGVTSLRNLLCNYWKAVA